MRRASPFGECRKRWQRQSAASKLLDHRRVAPEGLFQRPRLYLVGEAPGAAEAAQGKPFVGPAGNALRKMLAESGIDPGQLRSANAIPFRPIEHSKDCKPRNRSPTTEEIQCYGAAVLNDIRRSRPGVIVALHHSGSPIRQVTVDSSGPQGKAAI
jgi:uracil-DNA glycosylase family 4